MINALLDMALEDDNEFFAWIVSTWLPHIQQVPKESKEEYISEVVAIFVRNNPPDDKGYFNGQMKRLKIEASP